MKEKKKAVTAGIFLAFVFVISLLFLLTSSIGSKRKMGSYADIYQHGELVKTVFLSEETVFVLEGEDGAYNEIQVKNGAIGITKTSCPDGLCQKMGFLSGGLVPIICLPNELVIEIHNDAGAAEKTDEQTETKQEEIDGVVY